MRIAFIKIPRKGASHYVPLGLLCLASYVKQYGYNPIIVDLDFHFAKQKFMPNFFRQAAKMSLKDHPQVLGFSVMCTTLPAILLIAEECKKLAPHIPIIFGGPEVSFEEVELLKNFKQVDIIVRGEGEITLTEVLHALERKKSLSDVLGITFRENNRIIRNPDRPFIKNLDDLPSLDFSLLPHLEKYEPGLIEGGRGCPFRCTFCSTCKMWKRTLRLKSPQKLAHELKDAYRIFKKNENSRIWFVHDNFLISRKAAEKFLSLITGENLAWDCSARLEVLDESLIKMLKKAGLRSIYLGIESASPKIQKEIKKNLPLSRLPQVLEMLSQNDIRTTISFIVGFSNEKISQTNQTLLMALRSKLYNYSSNVQIHSLTLLKGSDLYTKVKEKFTQIKFWQTNISPPLTNLFAELSLIKKYPVLFPSFYHKQDNEGSLKVLEKICILFTFLINSFPLTTLLLLKFLKTNPLLLGQEIISSYKAAKKNMIFAHDQEVALRYCFLIFKDFIQKKSNLLIMESFLHETLLQKSNFLEDKSCPPHYKINLRSCPIIPKKVKFKAYNYDLFNLTKRLKNRSVKEIHKNICFIAYLPGKIAKTVPLNHWSYALLSLCNGKRSIGEIIAQFQEQEKRTKEISRIILEKFRFLQQEGIISISNPAQFKKKN